VIASGGVDNQHCRRFDQGSHGRLEKGALADCEVATPIDPTRKSGHSRAADDMAVLGKRSTSPTRVTLVSSTAGAPPETRKHASDGLVSGKDPEGSWSSTGKGFLEVGELGERRRPGHRAIVCRNRPGNTL
jgi:hypothetical protein